MTLASDIITAAYREGNLIAAGTTPTTAEQTEALALLNSFIAATYGQEMGEPLVDWIAPAPQRTAPVAAAYPQLPYPTSAADLYPFPFQANPSQNIYVYPPTNSRIIFGGVALTLYFPEAPDDGARMMLVQGSGAGDNIVPGSTLVLDGNGRTIEASNTKSYTTPVTARQWFYRADTANWQAVLTLNLGDTIPFPTDFDDYWTVQLFVRLAPRYGKPVSNETADTIKRMRTAIKTRYRQKQRTVYGSYDFPNSLQGYVSGRWGY